jgi:6-phosphogluconolactonase
MTKTRRLTLLALGLALALAGLSPALQARHDDDDDGFRSGKVFTSTNATAGNELMVYDTAPESLSLAARIATQGTGTGGGLGNQGAVTLSGDGRYLFVVNAGSHSVSTFRVRRSGVVMTSVTPSGGLRPVSVTEHDGLIYVLNADGSGNVTGFRNHNGQLEAVTGGMQPLSAATGTAPAQVGFGQAGRTLIVTEKATNKLTTYRVRDDGSLDAPVVTASAGATPFGFAVDQRGTLLVSEAFGGAAGASALSSYGFANPGAVEPMVVSPSVGTTQTAACWVVVTPNGRWAYTTNTGSNTISLYGVMGNGQIALRSAVGASTDAGPIDAAISPRGRQLFVLNAGAHSIQGFAIARNSGELSPMGRADGLVAGSTGLAAN